MALLLAVMGGLVGTMNINVLEQTCDTGMLRAIIASNCRGCDVLRIEGVRIGIQALSCE